jgi:hypothetical protein
MNCSIEYPYLPVKTDHDNIQISINELWFNLSRKSDKGLSDFNRETLEILKLLKTKVRKDPSFMKYIEIMFLMIAHTRDIAFGRGERDIVYGMLYVWYQIFPVLAVYALDCVVNSHNQSDLTYGSWKDIARLCDYIRRESHNDDHPLILTAIEMANRQLRLDILNLRDGKPISNVSKWIPREKSKRDWLYDMFVKDFFPRMHRSRDSFDIKLKSYFWHKSKYRKILSKLNAHNNTLEIKLCENKWSRIDFRRDMTNEALKKYWNVLMNQKGDYMLFDRVESSQKALQYVQNKFTEVLTCNSSYNIPCSEFYSLGKLVKQAIDLSLAQRNFDPSSLEYIAHKYEIHIINTIWYRISSKYNKSLGNVIPIIDVSLTMAATDEIYSAIGYAYLIAEKSNIKNRMIAFSHQTEWISWKETSFVDAINDIMSQLPSFTSKRFEGVVSLLKEASFNTRYNLNNTKLILISDFDETITDDHNIIYWNLSKQYVTPVNTNRFISGDSMISFWQLCNILSTDNTQFEIVCNALYNSRYAKMRDRFIKVTCDQQ